MVSVAAGGWLFDAKTKDGIGALQAAGLSVALLLFYFSNYWGIQSCLHRLEASLREMIQLLIRGDIGLASLEFRNQIDLELKDSVARQKLTKWIHVPLYVVLVLFAWSLKKS